MKTKVKMGMPESLWAQWKPRGETVEQLAARMSRWISAMREIHPAFAEWYPSMNSRRTAVTRPLHLAEPANAARLIQENITMSDGPDPQPVPGCGYAPSAWIPIDVPNEKDISFLATIGIYTDMPEHFREIFKLTWSNGTPLLSDAAVVRQLFVSLVDAWDPLFCKCQGYWHPKSPQHRVRWDMWTPAVGWMLYLSGRRLTRSDVPSAFDVQPCGQNGTLIIVRENPIDMDVPGDVALADRVRVELGLPPNYTIEHAPSRKQ